MEIYVIKNGEIWVPTVFSEELEDVKRMLDKMGSSVKEELATLIAAGVRVAFEYAMEEKGTMAYVVENNGYDYIVFSAVAVTRCKSPNRLKWLATLRHEARHVEQRRCGRLVVTKDGGRVWDGAVWSRERIARKGYYSLPWEIDARDAELDLYMEHEEYIPWVVYKVINAIARVTKWYV